MTNDRNNLQRRNADLRRLDKLIEQRKYRIALPFVRELVAKFPEDTIVHVGLALCLSETGQRSEALDVLQAADRRFPNDYTILYHIAETQNELEAFEDAERTYRKSLDLTPASCHVERSECYNGLGVVLWRQHKKGEALEVWKLAIRENPKNRMAQGNLRELTNQYGEPLAVSQEMDDLFHFINVQQELYLKGLDKPEFSAKQEAETFFTAVKEVWNAQVAERGKELDTMTPEEKTKLFRAVKVDHSRISESSGSATPKRVSGKTRRRTTLGQNELKLQAMMNERFDFLPSYTGTLVMIAGSRALIAAGMEPERCVAFVKGEAKATEEEKDIILWAYDLIKTLVIADTRKDTPEETGLILRAMSIAKEFLSEEEAVDTVHAVHAELQKVSPQGH
ncbi:MAG: tetratricopeptide repeat protein [Bacteroidetes bacterium]|nr:tetratricopeptide repeat protein [Bacteroidota bacterium]